MVWLGLDTKKYLVLGKDHANIYCLANQLVSFVSVATVNPKQPHITTIAVWCMVTGIKLYTLMQVSATLYHMDLFNGDILERIKDDTSLRIAGASQRDSMTGFCVKKLNHTSLNHHQTRIWARRY